MIRNNLSYEDLLRDRGIANELNWKPNFIKEKYYDHNGNLRVQYFADEEGRKHGSCIRYYANGIIGYEGTYDHGTETTATYFYGNGVKACENQSYWFPKWKLDDS